MRALHVCIFAFLLSLGTAATAATYAPEGDIIGTMEQYSVKKDDNLYVIARKFDIGIVELLAANPGVDPWTPQESKELAITNMHVLPPIPYPKKHGTNPYSLGNNGTTNFG